MFLKWLTADNWRFESAKRRLIKFVRSIEPERRDFSFSHEGRNEKDLGSIQGFHRLVSPSDGRSFAIAIVRLNDRVYYPVIEFLDNSFDFLMPGSTYGHQNWFTGVKRFPENIVEEGSVYLQWLIVTGLMKNFYLQCAWSSHWLRLLITKEREKREEQVRRLAQSSELQFELSFANQTAAGWCSVLSTTARSVQLAGQALEPIVGASDNHRAMLHWFKGMNNFLTYKLHGGVEHQLPEVPVLKGGRRRKLEVSA